MREQEICKMLIVKNDLTKKAYDIYDFKQEELTD